MWLNVVLAVAFALPSTPITPLSGGISPTDLSHVPCSIPDYGQGFCFRFAVPENHTNPRGRRVSLYVAYFPAFERNAVDAITPLDGGPGEGSATEMQGYFSAADVRLLRKHHALLFVDERGTGLSAPIDCPTQWENPQRFLDEPVPLLSTAELTNCRQTLAKRVDLSEYNTTAVADDIDEIRSALGIRKLSLMGFSGGTLTAQVYVRRYHQNVRAIVIGGITTPDFHHPAPTARARQIALNEVLRECTIDSHCSAQFPHLERD